MIKIWRSPYSEFGKFSRIPNDLQDETITADNVYTDEVLSGIATSGFNGIWLHGLLHNLVQATEFPEFGQNSAIHLEKLSNLIERAAKYGIKIYLYMQPPRAIPVENEAFWKNHADVAGQLEEIQGDGDSNNIQVYSLCTSTEKVKNYLKHAAARLASKLPDLGGLILITASEYPAHCITRRGKVIGALGEDILIPPECPRCTKRKPEEIIAEIISLVRDGIRSVSKTIEIIAWNWSWSFFVDIPCTEIIELLPKDVILMTTFERGGRKDILGHKNHKIDEYSIAYAGPSEECRESFAVTEKLGMRTLAKLQFGTTHELATVPSLPLLGNLYQKADFLRKNHLAGFMGCWNFGNMITANTAAFNWFLTPECPDSKPDALKMFAANYFPGCNSEKIATAWEKFAEAMDAYPFCIPYLYAGPTNWALSYLTRPEQLNKISAGRSWLLDERGDDLSNAIADFSLDEIIAGFRTLSEKWQDGIKLLKSDLKNSSGTHNAEELANAEVCGAAFLSTFHLFSIYKLRLEWNVDKLDSYRKLIAAELENVKTVLPLVEADKRFGYHSEAHGYMFDAASIKDKITALQKQLQN